MGIPQIIFIVYETIQIILSFLNHGKDLREMKNHYCLTSLTLLGLFTLFFLGGFFSHGIGSCQIILIVLFSLSYLTHILKEEIPSFADKLIYRKFNVVISLIGKAVIIILLVFGGFFN